MGAVKEQTIDLVADAETLLNLGRFADLEYLLGRLEGFQRRLAQLDDVVADVAETVRTVAEEQGVERREE